jgi:hypothetical protein
MKLSKPALSFLLGTVSFVSIIVLFFCKPILQDENFHHFADVRNIFSVTNFWNVISNLIFLLIGIAALQKLHSNKLAVVTQIRAAYYFFFIGILLVAFGSAWYHYNPNNTTLMWDRLPMTIAFMSLLSIALAEFISVTAGRIGLIPFLITGIFSITWWQYGEQQHHGDLRLYALVQFLPILLLALLFLFGHSVYNTKWGYLTLFGAYVLAKLAEHFDAGIYKLTGGLMAGHFLKHIIIAIGLYLFVVYLQKRKAPILSNLSN